MKKSIKTIIAISALVMGFNACAATSQYECQIPIFHALTAKGEKEVKLCLSASRITYTFGKRHVEKPELDIAVPKNATSFYSLRYGDEANIKNGAYTYTIDVGADEDGKAINYLKVYKGGEQLAKIQLRIPETNIIRSLDDYGIEVEK